MEEEFLTDNAAQLLVVQMNYNAFTLLHLRNAVSSWASWEISELTSLSNKLSANQTKAKLVAHAHIHFPT